MRRLAGLVLIVLGVLGMLVGAVLATAFGPDDRMATGPHRLATPGEAILTAPEALAYAGPRVRLTVSSVRPGREMFVGVGHHVDVQDFLADTPRTRVETIAIPWQVTTAPVPGAGSPKRARPSDLGWWIADAQGRGTVVLTWHLPDVAADVVILDRGDGDGDGLRVDVTAALVAPGAFVGGLAAAVVGLGIAVFGWVLRSTRRAP